MQIKIIKINGLKYYKVIYKGIVIDTYATQAKAQLLVAQLLVAQSQAKAQALSQWPS